MSTDLEPAGDLVPTRVSFIDRAIERGVIGDQLTQLVELYRKLEADKAANEFAQAITGFQAEMPQVKKDRTAGTGSKIQFSFASLDDIMSIAGPLLAKYRIVPTFTTEPIGPALKVTCRIRVGTHSEESSLTIPVPQGNVNATQLMGQAISYGKRYALCAALNIVVTDEDNDATGQYERISSDQLSQLDTLFNQIREAGNPVNFSQFLAWCFNVDQKALSSEHCLSAIPAAKFDDAVKLLKRKLNGGAK